MNWANSVQRIPSLSAWKLFYDQNARLLRDRHAGMPWKTLENFVSDPWNRSLLQSGQEIQSKLVEGVPLQHCFETAYFYGLRLLVGPGCLIPRPETEGLVSLVLSTLGAKGDRLRGVDVGTGSGAIALALAQQRPNWVLAATERCAAALNYAKKNNALQRKKVSLIETDRLFALSNSQFNFVVSNPPYIPQSARSSVQQQVNDFEPSEALYLPDESYLEWFALFFQQIQACLLPGGIAFLEGESVYLERQAALAEKFGFVCSLEKDLAGSLRYLVMKN